MANILLVDDQWFSVQGYIGGLERVAAMPENEHKTPLTISYVPSREATQTIAGKQFDLIMVCDALECGSGIDFAAGLREQEYKGQRYNGPMVITSDHDPSHPDALRLQELKFGFINILIDPKVTYRKIQAALTSPDRVNTWEMEW